MRKISKTAALLNLIDTANFAGLRCDEVFIQRLVYFFQALLGVSLGYRFQFYKHAPFSFGLSDDIVSMRADNYLTLALGSYSYGACWRLTVQGTEFRDFHIGGMDRSKAGAETIIKRFGNRGAAELERLSTALYVSVSNWQRGENERAILIYDLVPHVAKDLALDAIQTINRLHDELS